MRIKEGTGDIAHVQGVPFDSETQSLARSLFHKILPANGPEIVIFAPPHILICMDVANSKALFVSCNSAHIPLPFLLKSFSQ